MNNVARAVQAAGNQAKLAEQLEVSQQAVSKWVRRGWVSPSRAREIEMLYGIPRQDLMNKLLVDLVDTNVYSDFDEA